jgi:hypothetical protein
MEGRAIASACPTRRGRRPWHVVKLFAREPGDLGIGLGMDAAGPHREDEESKPMMHDPEKSDPAKMLCTTSWRLCCRRFYVRGGLAGQVLQRFSWLAPHIS